MDAANKEAIELSIPSGYVEVATMTWLTITSQFNSIFIVI
jgi:hypothetical protein